MLTHQVRDVVAAIIVVVAMVVGALWAWSWASQTLAAEAAATAEQQAAPDYLTVLEASGASLDFTKYGTKWAVDAVHKLGVDEETAEKGTVALYGAIAGVVLGGAAAFVLSEPIARTLTALPNRRRRARLVV